MNVALWSLLAGSLLLLMALSATVLHRLPLSGSVVYLAVGMAISPLWLDLASLNLLDHAELLEHLTEVVLLLSLFTSGLKLSEPVGNWRWSLPVRLATLSMLITVLLISAIGYFWLGLPLGVAVLLSGVLAPTDPVLAAEVQVEHPDDRDELRFSLTGEGGLNDGAAFPIVLLGLGLIGLHDLGRGGMRWVMVDVLWASAAGLAAGALIGAGIGALVLYLRKVHKEAVGLDNFIALGVIALANGLALAIDGYGFLAVFAAGYAFRRVERRFSRHAAERAEQPLENACDAGSTQAVQAEAALQPDGRSAIDLATSDDKAGRVMAQAVLSFNEQLERLGEVVGVVAIGALLWTVDWSLVAWWFPALLILVVRPLSVVLGMLGTRSSRVQRRFIGWFGIKGLGSLYYLAYAVHLELPGDTANTLTALTLSVVACSVLLHGISVTPLMALYERLRPDEDDAVDGAKHRER